MSRDVQCAAAAERISNCAVPISAGGVEFGAAGRELVATLGSLRRRWREGRLPRRRERWRPRSSEHRAGTHPTPPAAAALQAAAETVAHQAERRVPAATAENSEGEIAATIGRQMIIGENFTTHKGVSFVKLL